MFEKVNLNSCCFSLIVLLQNIQKKNLFHQIPKMVLENWNTTMFFSPKTHVTKKKN